MKSINFHSILSNKHFFHLIFLNSPHLLYLRDLIDRNWPCCTFFVWMNGKNLFPSSISVDHIYHSTMCLLLYYHGTQAGNVYISSSSSHNQHTKGKYFSTLHLFTYYFYCFYYFCILIDVITTMKSFIQINLNIIQQPRCTNM
jgi:hypothetical protein